MSIRVSITITATAPTGMSGEDARRTAADLLKAAGFTIEQPAPPRHPPAPHVRPPRREETR